MKDEHTLMRENIMTEEEIKQSDKYLSWFKSSWADTDNRGLFDKWEMIDKYWEGDVNLPESDDDPASNTNIVNPNIEGQVVLTVDKNLSITTRGVEPSDVPFERHARIIGQFIIDKNSMRRKMDIFSRRRKKFGTGIMSCLFNPDKLDGMGLPELKPWNPAYVFFDPNITDVYEYNQGRFVILIANKSIYWAAEQFGEEKAEVIMPAYHPIESEWIYGEDDGESDEINRDNYLHMYIFTMKKGEVRLCQMSGCGVKLWDSEEEDINFPKGSYPIFIAPDMPREGTTRGKATAELLIGTQDIINDLDDQIRINARLTGNIQKVVGTGSGIDIDKWTNEPGLNIPAADPTAWTMVKPPEMPQYILQRRNEAFAERQIETRFSDQMSGVRQKGVDTATEALALHQTGLAGVDHDKAIIEEMLGDVLVYALELAKENWTQEQAFRITNEQNSFLWYRPSNLKNIPKLMPTTEEYRQRWQTNNPDIPPPEYIQGEGEEIDTKDARFDIVVSIGSGIPNNKGFKYNVIKEAFMQKGMSLEEYRFHLKEMGILPETTWEQEQKILMQLQQQRQPQQGESTMPDEDVEGMTQQKLPELQARGGITDAS